MFEQGFSVLSSDIPWESDSLWVTMAIYLLNLHIPLGYGGLSIASYVLNQPVLAPRTQVGVILRLNLHILRSMVAYIYCNIGSYHVTEAFTHLEEGFCLVTRFHYVFASFISM